VHQARRQQSRKLLTTNPLYTVCFGCEVLADVMGNLGPELRGANTSQFYLP
jgi:hypothetical protein